MKVSKLSKVLVESSVLAALALTFSGCGLQNQDLVKSKDASPAAETKKEKKASLSLAMPQHLPETIKEVQISLQRMYDDPCWISSRDKFASIQRPCSVGGALGYAEKVSDGTSTAKKQQSNSNSSEFETKGKAIAVASDEPGHFDGLTTTVFQLNGEPIQINDLEPGHYWVVIDLIDSNTGRAYSHGEGEAVVQVGLNSVARISMAKVVDTTGGLVIILEDEGDKPNPEPLPPTTICPAIGYMPSCVSDGRYFKVLRPQYDPNSCGVLPMPKNLTVVPGSLCKGLPEAEQLAPF